MADLHGHSGDDPPGGRAAEHGVFLAAAYDAHADGLYRYALMLLADPGAAEDAVQQAFVGLAQILRRGGDIASCESYLRAAVRHECWRAVRRRRRRLANVEGLSGSRLLEAAGGGSVDDDERARLEAALRSLPAEQREVVHLKVYEAWTFQQIAEFLGMSINSVASRYRYALAKLRRQLVPGHAGQGDVHEPR